MIGLQEKAHHSLDEFRKGKGSPLARHVSSSEPPTPVDDNDELAMLGGKTRLVKKEPSSPQIMDRSPTSRHPVVPLPLSASAGAHVDPNVLEYLSSFQSHHHHEQPPQSASSHNSYSDVDISPVSMYGMSTLPSTPFLPEPTSYISQSPTRSESLSQSMMQTQQPPSPTHLSHQPMMTNGNSLTSSFPQYFPVYDYGTSNMENGYGAPMLDGNPMPGQRRSSSGSPEANNMHSTWQDFVAGLSMN